MVYLSESETDTIRIATQLSTELVGGEVVLLFGDLGSGKTAFVRGLVEGLGGNADHVSSPTFALIQPYNARLAVQRVDLYRVSPPEIEDLGLEELATSSSVLAVEWADRLERWPTSTISVYIDDRGEDQRRISIERGE